MFTMTGLFWPSVNIPWSQIVGSPKLEFKKEIFFQNLYLFLTKGLTAVYRTS